MSLLSVDLRLVSVVFVQSGAFKLSKEGFLLLQFAPAAGVRQYDWSRKQVWCYPLLSSLWNCDDDHELGFVIEV